MPPLPRVRRGVCPHLLVIYIYHERRQRSSSRVRVARDRGGSGAGWGSVWTRCSRRRCSSRAVAMWGLPPQHRSNAPSCSSVTPRRRDSHDPRWRKAASNDMPIVPFWTENRTHFFTIRDHLFSQVLLNSSRVRFSPQSLHVSSDWCFLPQIFPLVLLFRFSKNRVDDEVPYALIWQLRHCGRSYVVDPNKRIVRPQVDICLQV